MNLTDLFFQFSQFGHEVTLWVLIALSVFSLAFIIERFFKLAHMYEQSRQTLINLNKAMQKKDFDVEHFSPPTEPILLEGLRYLRNKGPAGLEEFFNTRLRLLRPDLERFLTYLATVGSNAPFIGLLGTVFGVMDAFRGLVHSQGAAEAVMLGISQALVATAVGLMVAIPAVIAYNYFQKQVRLIVQNFESMRDLCVGYSKQKPQDKKLY